MEEFHTTTKKTIRNADGSVTTVTTVTTGSSESSEAVVQNGFSVTTTTSHSVTVTTSTTEWKDSDSCGKITE